MCFLGNVRNIFRRGKSRGGVQSGEMTQTMYAHVYKCATTTKNIFTILGCHKRDDTTQKSVGKAKFTSAEGCTPPGSLGGTHTGQEARKGFI
jgi:hypothetical protein